MKPKLLFLSAFLPSPNAVQAGQKTAYRNLQWLAEKHDVWLACFRNEADRPEDVAGLRAICREVHVQPVDKASRLLGLLQRPGLPLQVAARWHRGLADRIAQWRTEHAFVRAHLEYSQMTVYRQQLAGLPRQTLYVHDVLSQWADRRAAQRGFPWSLEARRCHRWERDAYDGCHGIFVPSRKDAQLLAALNPGWTSRLVVLPLHFNQYGHPDRSRPADQPRLLFWGAMGRKENADAARWLVHELLPRLKAAAIPHQLTLAGSQPPTDLIAQRSDTVIVPGFVDDPGRHFDAANLAVLPVFDGAGVKVKVLECLAAGLPVLTTAIGAEGIEAGPDDGQIVLPADPDSFRQEIERLWRSADELPRLGAAARRWGGRQAGDLRNLLLETSGPAA